MSDSSPRQVRSRDVQFAEKATTKIWEETPSKENPYIPESCHCHGYELFELMAKRSVVDVFYLMFRGELPSQDEARLLESLMIGMINPGPRHSATRAGMDAGIGKTDPAHILPIGLMILGGSHLGAGEIAPAMQFFRKNRKRDPVEVATELQQDTANNKPTAGDRRPVAGFGSLFGSIDIMSLKLAEYLSALPAETPVLDWGQAFVSCFRTRNIGWLNPGIAAAVFTDLGFTPRAGAGLFQLISAPGLLAHGVEQSNKPITAMPFVDDNHYVIETE